MNYINLKVINLSVIFSIYLTSCMFSDNQSTENIEYNDLIHKPIAVIVENRSNKEESKILYGEIKKEKEGFVFENNRKTIKLTFDNDKLQRTKKVSQEMKKSLEKLNNCEYVTWVYMENIEEPTSDMKKVGNLKNK